MAPTLATMASLAPSRLAPATSSLRSTPIRRVTKPRTLSVTRKDSVARKKMEGRRRLSHSVEWAALCSNAWAEAPVV